MKVYPFIYNTFQNLFKSWTKLLFLSFSNLIFNFLSSCLCRNLYKIPRNCGNNLIWLIYPLFLAINYIGFCRTAKLFKFSYGHRKLPMFLIWFGGYFPFPGKFGESRKSASSFWLKLHIIAITTNYYGSATKN